MNSPAMDTCRILQAFLLAIVLTLVGCGGGGGLGIVAGTGGGIGGTGVAMGSVTGFGSVIMVGRELDTTGATFTINGAPGNQSDLEVGQVVRAEVDFSDNTASKIEYAETTRGPVQSIDPVAGTFEVLGQSVITNGGTFFNGTSMATLMAGEIIEVSGERNGAKQIVASFVRLRTAVSEYRVIGVVENLSGNTFRIDGLTVDFSMANLSDLSSGQPSSGLIVEVEGAAADFNAATSSLVAASVGDGLFANVEPEDELEIEGVITSFTSANDFVVQAQRVNTNGSTLLEFDDGSPASNTDLGLNVKVEVEGDIDASGVLQADKVIVKPNNDVRLSALVEDVDASAGTLTMLGLVVNVTSLTSFEDDSSIRQEPFGLQHISAGQYLEVRGFLLGNTDIIAAQIERDDFDISDLRVEIRGPVDDVNPVQTRVTVLGIGLDTDNDTEFEGPQENALTSTAFYDLVEVGDIVEGRWDNFTSPLAPLDELGLED